MTEFVAPVQKVITVEDNPGISDLLKWWISPMKNDGFELGGSLDSPEGLIRMLEGDQSITRVVLDNSFQYGSPTGLSTLKKMISSNIFEKQPNLRVIFFTADRRVRSELNSLKEIFPDFSFDERVEMIEKPAINSEFREAIMRNVGDVIAESV